MWFGWRGGAAPDAKPEAYLGLIAPANGFQIRSIGVDIAPGEEREYCEVARLPGAPTDEYFVSSMELANGKSSHHLALAVAAHGTWPLREVEAVGVGNRIECPGPALVFGDGIELIATIQTHYGVETLPAGVARKHYGGDFVVFDYHYANPGVESLQARSAVNFHVIDPAKVEHVAGGSVSTTSRSTSRRERRNRHGRVPLWR